MTVGERIRECRKKKGLTQKQLGELCGMSASFIAQYENDLRNPKVDTISKIANVLEIPTSYFYGYGELNTDTILLRKINSQCERLAESMERIADALRSMESDLADITDELAEYRNTDG